MHVETRQRTFVKALTWRILATLTTSILVYGFTGHVQAAITVGSFEAVTKMVLYFLHERAWNRIHFGRKEATPAADRAKALLGSRAECRQHDPRDPDHLCL